MKKLPLALIGFLLCGISVFGQQQRDTQLFIDNANRYAREQKYKEAAAEITKFLKIEGQSAYFILKRAEYYGYLKEKEAVLRDVRSAISLRPNDTGVLQSGARLLCLSGHYEESLNIGNSLIARDANNPVGYAILHETLFFLKDFAGALENFIKVYELNPRLNRLSQGYWFECLEKLKDDKNIYKYYSRIFNIFEKIVNDSIALIPKKSSGLKAIDFNLYPYERFFAYSLQVLAINWAKLYEKKGETEKAGELLEKMVQFEPKIIAYKMRAKYHREHGRLEEAEKDEIKATELIIIELSESLKRLGDSPVAAFKLIERGDFYVRTKQFDKAIADYEKAMTLNSYAKGEATEKIDLAREKMRESVNQPD